MPAIRMISATHCGSVIPANRNALIGPVVSKVSWSARAKASLGAMPSRSSVPSMSKSARRIERSRGNCELLVGGGLDLVTLRATPHHNRYVGDVIAALSELRGELEARDHDLPDSGGVDVLDRIGR